MDTSPLEKLILVRFYLLLEKNDLVSDDSDGYCLAVDRWYSETSNQQRAMAVAEYTKMVFSVYE